MKDIIQLTYYKANLSTQDKEQLINKVETKISKIDSKIIETLYRKGTRIEIGDANVGVIFNAFASTKDGRNWKDVPGCYIKKGTVLNRNGGKEDIAQYSFSYSCPEAMTSTYGSFDLEYHELGHCVDDVIGIYKFNKKLSEEDTFIRLMKPPLIFDIGYNKVYLSEPLEYFAETFAMFHIDKKIKDMHREIPFLGVDGKIAISIQDQELSPKEYLNKYAKDVYDYFAHLKDIL